MFFEFFVRIWMIYGLFDVGIFEINVFCFRYTNYQVCTTLGGHFTMAGKSGGRAGGRAGGRTGGRATDNRQLCPTGEGADNPMKHDLE